MTLDDQPRIAPPKTSLSGIVSSNVRKPSPAIRGAAHAILQAPNNKPVLSDPYSGKNAALAAATFAGTARRRQPSGNGHLDVQNQETIPGRPVYKKSLSFQGSQETLNGASESLRFSREQSPSQMAAQLATARATPPLLNADPNHQLAPRRPSSHSRRVSTDGLPEELSTVPAKSLVDLYESKQEPKKLAPTTQSVRYANRPPPPVASPKPLRPLTTRSNSSASVLSASLPQALARTQSTASIVSPNVSRFGATAAATKLAGSTPVAPKMSSRNPPEPPPPRRSQPRFDGVEDEQRPPPSRTTTTAAIPPPPAPEPTSPPLPIRQPSSRSFSQPQSNPPPPPTLPSRPTNMITTHSSETYTPQLSVDSLANAMVASSLASSRAPSPTRPPLPPPPSSRRHGKPLLFSKHSQQDLIARTPSPAKREMRQTMRKPIDSDDEAADSKTKDPHRKKGLLAPRKHPNKHHEGDRKRYRTTITERERKRYEGVWAANRGLLLLLPTPAAGVVPEDNNNTNYSQMVINVVARDIWRRSRLPDDVLEEVWDLVDLQDVGMLGREEFVVGMWLIDQRLKGNKLPIKVPDSVWGSVRRLTGLKSLQERGIQPPRAGRPKR